MSNKTFLPINYLFPWPENAFPLLGHTLEDLYQNVGVNPDFQEEELSNGTNEISVEIAISKAFQFGYGFLPGLELIIGKDDELLTFNAKLSLKKDVDIHLDNFDIRLRFPKEWVVPVTLENGQFVEIKDENGDVVPYEISLENISVEIGENGFNITSDGLSNFDFPLFKIGEFDFFGEVKDASFNFDGIGQKPDGVNEFWKGIFFKKVKLFIPTLIEKPLELTDFGIGTGGFSGLASANFPISFSSDKTPKFSGPLSTKLLGLEGAISKIDVKFENSIPRGIEIASQLYIPYFDEPLGLLIGWTENDFNFKISGFDTFYIDDKCIAFKWTANDLGALASRFVPGILDNLKGKDIDSTFRLLRGDSNQIQEVRLDVDLNNQSGGQTFDFDIPGLKFEVPKQLQLSLVLQNESSNGILPHNAFLIARLQKDQEIKITSDFAWTREEDREIQNDASDEAPADPLMAFTLTAKNEVDLSLIKMDLKDPGLPTFLRQTQKLPELTFPATPDGDVSETLCKEIIISDNSISGNDFGADFDLDLEKLELPFLRNNPSEADSGSDVGNGGIPDISQFLRVSKPDEGVQISLDEAQIKCPLDLVLNIGPFEFSSGITLGFNWEKFAFEVDHNGGIDLYLDMEEVPKEELFGLDWTFRGKKVVINEGQSNQQTKYHFFTLVTKNYHYQVTQANGAVIELAFTKASKEPIVFAVSDFVLSSKGINLTAEVTNRPARLNGIDTKFTFSGTRFQIIENKIKDFTLSGSGPLPPDLVGEAMADVSLQFAQRDGALTLIAGGAQLRGNKLLDAKNTRFQFKIDAIGLKFVNDGKFHLFFTLTGSAAFVPITSDDQDWALAPLSKIKIDFIECPLTGDASVLFKHIKFEVELPKKVSFNFLGCFEMELRGIGFIPQADPFNGDASMLLNGQVLFAKGGFDTKSAKVDFHGLYIGIPSKGEFVPRIHLQRLAVDIKFGDAFSLHGVVSYLDDTEINGFMGEGSVDIKGLPTLAATFSFVRVRRDENSAWLRAWFLYLEVRKISLQIPVINLYLREVGLGFGYRYTITSIKAADNTNDVGELLKNLRKLSRTQGNLSQLDSWAVDLEDPGQDPRWTIVFRAMISQTSASSPLRYNDSKEKNLPCTFLFDAVIAFRSDLTFFMAVRVWLNTNYNDFITDSRFKSRPLLSGFVLLSVRQKRFLASIASNPDGLIGDHPPFPSFIKEAISNSQFSITLLIEPGLFHYEMGWPNMLRYKQKVSKLLEVEIRAGFIFRVSKREMVIGQSLVARGRLKLEQSLDLGIVGVRVFAIANVAYGARFIGVIGFADPKNDTAFYAAIGLEIRVRFAVNFWIKIKLGFVKIKISISFSLNIGFTASLEVGITASDLVGLRGRATISVGALGKSIRLGIKVGINEGAVNDAIAKTERFLKIGLEATDVEPVPGTEAANRMLPSFKALTTDLSNTLPIQAPPYNIFVVREKIGGFYYFVLLPKGENGDIEETGFLPVPPDMDTDPNAPEFRDFTLKIPELASNSFHIEQFVPDYEYKEPNGFPEDEGNYMSAGGFAQISPEINSGVLTDTLSWRAHWDKQILEKESVENVEPADDLEQQDAQAELDHFVKLRGFLENAFLKVTGNEGDENTLFDPKPLFSKKQKVEDERVYNPSDNAFEAAVKGAVEQFRGSPYFKRDPNVEYDRILGDAFDDNTSIYGTPTIDENGTPNPVKLENEQVDQLRGLIIHDLVSDLKKYASLIENNEEGEDVFDFTHRSIAFQMGLVFRIKVDDGEELPDWLAETSSGLTIKQREGQTENKPNSEEKTVDTFNIKMTDYQVNPPQFQRIRQYTDANTIAITWDLMWDNIPDEKCSNCQADPEHHLQHYQVKRRTIDNSEPELVYTVKNAEVLSLDGDVLQALQPRFKIVDHFNFESLEAQANLPEEGRTYLYTITPVDFNEHMGRSLTVVATRFPNIPPQVPVESELVVNYQLPVSEYIDPVQSLSTNKIDQENNKIKIIRPSKIELNWNEPIAFKEGPNVPVETYRLIFRRDDVLPLGNYGLDAATQGPRNKKLPTSNARPLPTDVKINIDSQNIDKSPEGANNNRARKAIIPLETLQEAGILPPDDNPEWRPEAWKIFIQTESLNKVPSALVPVSLILSFEPGSEDNTSGIEERRPELLEFLPRPLFFELLPPEDSKARHGMAHFPMLKAMDTELSPEVLRGQYIFKLEEDSSSLDAILHRVHPAGIRAIRFRWNQGPSSKPNYPLNLNAGYEILQLDTDAYSTDTFENKEELARAVSNIQEVRMVPADDLLLIPGDTLNTIQWEAWYPSTMQRLRTDAGQSDKVEGSETPFGPWYSWRDSMLIWPKWPDLENALVQQPDTYYHPLLEGIADYLEALEEGGTGQLYTVDKQIPPPIQPIDEKQFLISTATEADPYGWGVLQRFGLTTTLSVRLAETGELIEGKNLMDLIKEALNQILQLKDNPGNLDHLQDRMDLSKLKELDLDALLPHLHIEHLFQQGKSVQFEELNPADDSLLGIVQISLRPIIKQRYQYTRVAISGASNQAVKFTLEGSLRCTMINQADTAAGETQLEPNEDKLIKGNINLPVNGKTSLLYRCKSSDRSSKVDLSLLVVLLSEYADEELEKIREQLPIIATHEKTSIELMEVDGKNSLVIQIEDIFAEGEKILDLSELLAYLKGKDKDLAAFKVISTGILQPTDERSTYFSVPDLTSDFLGTGLEGKQWQLFKRYAESSNSLNEEEPQISIPDDQEDLTAYLPNFLIWSHRFFDHTSFIETNKLLASVDPATGPWLVTAYPRASTPAFASPDSGGRIKYDHLIEDQYAHNYRFYIRPNGRYDLLWESLRQSPAFNPKPEGAAIQTFNLAKATPAEDKVNEEGNEDENIGGLDVVLDRIKAVSTPVILNSGRLDEESTPAKPAEPGQYWEVIIAQHPEQALMERNTTLYRQLSFRQVAFSLLRRINSQLLAYPGFFEVYFSENLSAELKELSLDYVADVYPDIPGQLDKPRTLDLTALTKDDRNALRIPKRINKFSQNATVLQWRGLPFFYEQQLLLIAQTSSTVSKVNSVVQSDFHYQSPDPRAIYGFFDPASLVNPIDSSNSIENARPLILLEVQQLWDALSPLAKAQWPEESPAEAAANKWRISALPDLEVVYQIVELFSGNIEVQTEYSFAKNAEQPGYELKTLGKRYLTEAVQNIIPVRDPAKDKFWLSIPISFVPVEQSLPREIDIPDDLRDKFQLEINPDADPPVILRVLKPINPEEVYRILWRLVEDLNSLKIFLDIDPNTDDPIIIKDFVDQWYTLRLLEDLPDFDLIDNTLRSKLEFPFQTKEQDIPEQIREKLLIEPNLVSWKGMMNFHELDALEFVKKDIQPKGLRKGIDELIQALREERSLKVAYQSLEDPFYDIQKPEGFEIVVNRGTDNETDRPIAIWTLTMDGAFTEEDFTFIRGLSSEPNFQEGMDRLINSITTRVTIEGSDEDEINGIQLPDGKPDKLSYSAPDLEWIGLMSANEESILQELAAAPETQEILKQAIIDLIAAIKVNVPSALNDFNQSTNIQMPYPLFDGNQLANCTGIEAFSSISINTSQGELSMEMAPYTVLTRAQIMQRVSLCVHPNDPIIASLEAILDLLDEEITSKDYDSGVLALRIRQTLLEVERDQLQEAFSAAQDKATVQKLYEDLIIKANLEKLLKKYTVETVLSNAADISDPILNGMEAEESDAVQISFLGKDLEGLDQLQADEGFNTAINEIVELINSHQIRIPLARQVADEPDKPLSNFEGLSVKVSEVSDSFLDISGVEMDEESGFYTAFIFKGAIDASTRTALLNADVPLELELAIRKMLEEADRHFVQLLLNPGFEFIPEEIRRKFEVVDNGTDYVSINWKGNILDDEEQVLKNWLLGFLGNENLLDALLASLQDLGSLVIPMEPLIPNELEDKIQLTDRDLAWLNPAETDVEFLQSWKENETTTEPIKMAIDAGLDSFNNNPDQSIIVVSLPEKISIRPRQEDLPGELKEVLELTGTSLVWKSLVNTRSQMDLLRDIGQIGDEAFLQSIHVLEEAISEILVSLSLDPVISIRPSNQDLPEELQDKLSFGNQLLRVYGPLTFEQGRLLNSQFENPLDRQNIQAFYNASVRTILQNKDIRIRSRRGAAAPSNLDPLEFKKLEE